MKRIALALLTCLLLLGFSVSPSRTQGPPSPKEIQKCRKECEKTYRDCVRSGGDEPLCEAALAFCNDCCTGGCRAGE